MNDEEIQRLAERLREPARRPADATGIDATDANGAIEDDADDAIPMLTEVVAPPARTEAAPIHEVAPMHDGSSMPEGAPALDAAAEDRIVERVLERLLGDPDLLDGPMRDAIASATERFAEQLATELRATLVYALHDALAPAVREAVREAGAGGPAQGQRPL